MPTCGSQRIATLPMSRVLLETSRQSCRCSFVPARMWFHHHFANITLRRAARTGVSGFGVRGGGDVRVHRVHTYAWGGRCSAT
jgi:hypothetical protein